MEYSKQLCAHDFDNLKEMDQVVKYDKLLKLNQEHHLQSCEPSLVVHTEESFVTMQSSSLSRIEPEIGREGGWATCHILVLPVPLCFRMGLQGV